MFITFHQENIMQELQLQRIMWKRTLILKKSCPATSYVVATFHLTIGQCAHQSLSNTATPELGMISSWSKGILADSYIAKGATKLSQANTVGFIRLQGKTNQQMGFTGHSTKPSHSWVSQTVHSQANIHLKDQSSQQMGLSDCTQSIHLIVGFIKQFIAMPTISLRTIQANR